MFLRFVEFWETYKPTLIETEVHIFSDELKVAGTCDLIVEINGELPKVGDTLVEAIVSNSHNGMATLNIKAGLHRLVCANGLTVPTNISDAFRVRHTGFELDDVKRLTEDFSKRLQFLTQELQWLITAKLYIFPSRFL